MNLFTAPDYTDQRRILELALQHGWKGNLYHYYLLYSLMVDENPLSLIAERRELPGSSLYHIGLENIKELLQGLQELTPTATGTYFENFSADVPQDDLAKWMSTVLDTPISAEHLFQAVLEWYKINGCGVFGTSSVFNLEGEKDALQLLPGKASGVCFDDLIGYEEQKQELCTNTETFLKGGFANNVLLYGDAGTGKSTSIMALVEKYAKDGLKIIQIHKNQTELLPALFNMLRKRNYHFILALDDLSFESDEREYKALKSALEGDVTSIPKNVLVYATSNRRHLVQETWNDRSDTERNGDVHRSETMEEKLSLSARFGLRIFYPAPSFKEYQAMVKQLATANSVASAMPQEELAKLAGRWQISAGSTSGRTAKQFINSLQ